MGCMPQVTNPFDIGMDEILPGLPHARHLSVGEYTPGHLLQSCLVRLLELCPLLVDEPLLFIPQ
jgi:hypothetical protein